MEIDVLNTPWGEEYKPTPATAPNLLDMQLDYEDSFPILGFGPKSIANIIDPAKLAKNSSSSRQTKIATPLVLSPPAYSASTSSICSPQIKQSNTFRLIPQTINLNARAFGTTAGLPQSSQVPGSKTAPTSTAVGSAPTARSAQKIPITKPVQPVAPAPTPAPAWSTKKALFPEAPPPVAPTAELLAKLSVTNDKPLNHPAGRKYHFFDPADPEFKVGRFYISITNKYKCPHKGCTKSFPASSSFIAHLKSPAHLEEAMRLKCPHCLRYYDTATALTQHAESQGVRCKIRKQDQYGVYVDEITASTAAVDGVHDDNTVKYVVNDLSSQGQQATVAQQVAIANAAFLKKDSELKSSYWDAHKPKW